MKDSKKLEKQLAEKQQQMMQVLKNQQQLDNLYKVLESQVWRIKSRLAELNETEQ